MTLYRRDKRAHFYRCDVCGKGAQAYFYQDVADHLPEGWVHIGDSWAQEDSDVFLCPKHTKHEGLVRLMLRLADREQVAGQVDLHVGMWLHKIRSGRDAQVAAFDATHVWLTWDDHGAQTRVERSRLNRTNEWKVATQ